MKDLVPINDPLDPFVCTKGDAQEIMDRIGFAPNLRGLIGEAASRSVTRLDGGEPLGGVIGITQHESGFLLKWRFEKADACGSTAPFAYAINAYVPAAVRRSRALELALNAFRCFLEHELREGFLYGTERPFHPHPRIES